MEIRQLRDFDNFLYYGKGLPADETASDLLQILEQDARTLLYSRTMNCAGVREYENAPNTAWIKALLPFNIVSAIAQRNISCGNGQDGTIERRVVVSQSLVDIQQSGGNLDVSVSYIPFSDIKKQNSVSFKVGLIK